MVVGEGFEPSKAEPADLQSAPFGHSGTPPNIMFDTLFFLVPFETSPDLFQNNCIWKIEFNSSEQRQCVLWYPVGELNSCLQSENLVS